MAPAIEIAKVAAILAGQRQINPETAKAFTLQAIGLLGRCEEERTKEINQRAAIARNRAIQAKRESYLSPEKFPAPFDECLRIWMPGKRLEDREKCYRDYVMDKINGRKICSGGEGENPDVSIEEEAASWISNERQSGFKRGIFQFLSEQFQTWLPKYEAENRRKRARAGAEGLKKKRKQNG